MYTAQKNMQYHHQSSPLFTQLPTMSASDGTFTDMTLPVPLSNARCKPCAMMATLGDCGNSHRSHPDAGGALTNDSTSTSSAVRGPSTTVCARRQCQGTCAMLRVTLGWAVTRSLRRLPHHVYVCSNVSVLSAFTTCTVCPCNADKSASGPAAVLWVVGVWIWVPSNANDVPTPHLSRCMFASHVQLQRPQHM